MLVDKLAALKTEVAQAWQSQYVQLAAVLEDDCFAAGWMASFSISENKIRIKMACPAAPGERLLSIHHLSILLAMKNPTSSSLDFMQPLPSGCSGQRTESWCAPQSSWVSGGCNMSHGCHVFAAETTEANYWV